jgi:hypothetical protein
MDVVKKEPDSDEDFLSEEQQIIDVKLEDDAVPEPFCIVKTEAYVSCMFYFWFIPLHKATGYFYYSCYTPDLCSS